MCSTNTQPTPRLSIFSCYLCGDTCDGSFFCCRHCADNLPFVYESCERCGRTPCASRLCGHCVRKTPGFDSAITLLKYEFPARDMLLSLKYKQRVSIARELGQLLAKKILDGGRDLPEQLIPVPLHPFRKIHRGYNQALEIARAISHKTGVPILHFSCKRTRNTKPQFLLDPESRRENVLNAFHVQGDGLANRVAIVDDIVTTGHTADEMACSLKKAGADDVALWALARAEPH